MKWFHLPDFAASGAVRQRAIFRIQAPIESHVRNDTCILHPLQALLRLFEAVSNRLFAQEVHLGIGTGQNLFRLCRRRRSNDHRIDLFVPRRCFDGTPRLPSKSARKSFCAFGIQVNHVGERAIGMRRNVPGVHRADCSGARDGDPNQIRVLHMPPPSAFAFP